MFWTADGRRVRRKRNWKSPLVEREVGGRPGMQEAAVRVVLFHNQRLAGSQTSRLGSSHVSEHIHTAWRRRHVSVLSTDVGVVRNMQRERFTQASHAGRLLTVFPVAPESRPDLQERDPIQKNSDPNLFCRVNVKTFPPPVCLSVCLSAVYFCHP